MTKLCVKDGVGQSCEEAAEEEEAEAGYRIKNKNPTQRCRELALHCYTIHFFFQIPEKFPIRPRRLCWSAEKNKYPRSKNGIECDSI